MQPGRQSVVRLTMGDIHAMYGHEEVFCKECITPLTPANRLINTLGHVVSISGRRMQPFVSYM
eukprot:5826749-Prorocentrum_lima.AAC.1